MAITALTALVSDVYDGGKNLVRGALGSSLVDDLNTLISTINQLVTNSNSLQSGSPTGTPFGGATLWTKAGVPDVAPNSVGDLWLDTAAGDLYIASAALLPSDFKLVTRAP